ncbi:Telomere_Sde2 domain-containing protein/Telomere_Sde2_2 domain-containing protein [Cephalotus follicularis]|uniref:Telomere_Sde2 domain-containing protein/Telomere_Sde2_2 domain-containing protein n=1 Tax=Cephalotus follicularis TaxID=3775 RepID=A0A1Q3B8X2_CEPFO|nr:Telomere_Sde2 domain-containing protein/Telomere_Sde2_2 domain-containing protein [Cephalotus follicularis]
MAMEMTTTTTTNAITKKPLMLQLFLRSLSGKTLTLNFSTPRVFASTIKSRVYEITRIPVHLQRLIYHGYQLEDISVISQPDTTLHLVPRLLGGKGGFGSLLRGAATKAGQKKTNNFDACRDMSGRRLRHVNAEKKLEEWRLEEEERKLERIAEDFIKKKSKTGKKGVGDGEAAKYVEKYMEESAKCVAVVEKAVRVAFGKRKKGPPVSDSKRLKIWMGKRKLAESDEDSSDNDIDEENKKSNVVNSGNENEKSDIVNSGIHSNSNKETERSSFSVTGGKHDGDFSGGASCQSGSEEQIEAVVKKNLECNGSSGRGDVRDKENSMVQPEIFAEKAVQSKSVSCSEAVMVSETEAVQAEGKMYNEIEYMKKLVVQPPSVSSTENGEGFMSRRTDSETSGHFDIKSGADEEAIVVKTKVAESEKPLNLDEFNSAAELEVLGLERLKSELLGHGLKCGGTLQERAARLFLLKSTPLEKLPKKLLAKK